MSHIDKTTSQKTGGIPFERGDVQVGREFFTAACKSFQKLESTLGGYLQLLRQRREMQIHEIAAKAGFSEAQWARWESGQQVPSMEEIYQICERFKFGEAKRKKLLKLKIEFGK